MSCDGWGVGNRCRARKNFVARILQVGGHERQFEIRAGDEGEVTDILPGHHMLYVFWPRLDSTLPVTHDQIRMLERLTE
jgi:hypothetical protein